MNQNPWDIPNNYIMEMLRKLQQGQPASGNMWGMGATDPRLGMELYKESLRQKQARDTIEQQQKTALLGARDISPHLRLGAENLGHPPRWGSPDYGPSFG
jgi:hypothetical protein